MNSLLQVFVGGIFGTSFRYIIGIFVPTLWMLFIVNVVGSFLLGSINKFYEKKGTEQFKLFFTTGMLGSFTTFSSFSQQWVILLKQNLLYGSAFGIGMMLLCLIAAFLGYKMAG